MRLVFLYLVLSLPYVGAYTMLGLGITVIYQSSRVLNLAHGAIAMVGAYTTYELFQLHLPLPLAFVGGLAGGGAGGLLVERVFVRRLRKAGPTSQTVGTVAALTLAIAIIGRLFGSLPVIEPQVLPSGALHLPGGALDWDLFLIFPIGLVAAAALFGLLQFTDFGLAMRAAAQNRRGAALRGVDPDRTTSLAWLIGGVLAAFTGILLAGATTLDPFGLSLGVLPAFVAVLIGGLDSLPGVLIGATIVGLVQGMVPALARVPGLGSILDVQGAPQLVLALLALGVMAMRGARFSVAATAGDTL